MRNLFFTLGLLTSLLSYSSVTSTFITHLGEPAFEFEVTDPAYMPAYYYDAVLDAYPPDGWSYFWQTDEGAISHAEKPIFFFDGAGPHEVTVLMVPRKKEEDLGIVQVTHTINVTAGQTSGNSNGDIMNDPIYFLTPPRYGESVYIIAPLNSCEVLSIPHNEAIAFDNSKLSFTGILNVANYSSGSKVPHSDVAMGEPTNAKIDFVVNFPNVRTDMAAVLEFFVFAQPGEAVAVKHLPDARLPNQCKSETEAIEFGIVGPYDPNYKESSIDEINVTVTDSSKLDSTSVEYTIHFQNIGTGPVDSITVVDTLPDYLVFDSHITSSLPAAKVNFSKAGNVLTWRLAPDADVKGTNESPSQPEYRTKGWVRFRAKISPEQDITYDTCYCLCNKATIYFDSLAPITTKTDIIAIGDQVCFSFVDNNDKNGTYAEKMCFDSSSYYGSKTAGLGSIWKVPAYSPIKAYPNPTTGTVHLEGDFHGELLVNVFSTYGQLMKEITITKRTLDLTELPAGAYTVQLSDGDKRYIARVIRY